MWRFFCELLILVQFALNTCIERRFFRRIQKMVLRKIALVARDEVLRFPVIHHGFGDVFGGVMLRVTFHAHGLHFDYAPAAAGAALIHRGFRGVITAITSLPSTLVAAMP